jgi:cystathionine gamma-synthase
VPLWTESSSTEPVRCASLLRRSPAVCAALQVIHHATSLGAVESTIERRAAVPGQTHLPPGLLRLSVGCEHPDDLWADLQQALNA